jgi:hypothetical protein
LIGCKFEKKKFSLNGTATNLSRIHKQNKHKIRQFGAVHAVQCTIRNLICGIY